MSRQNTTTLPIKTVKRLAAAEGYLQLGMPGYALSELAHIDDAGPLNSSFDLLAGEALRMTGDFADAVRLLERAARTLPSPLKTLAWRALADCYRQLGHNALADFAETISTPAQETADSVMA